MTTISSIGAIRPILPIVGIPPIVMFPVRAFFEFRVENLPSNVQELFRKRSPWLRVLDEAILSGMKDINLLADLIFFMHHPERVIDGVGKLIDPKEEHFIRLRAEWNHYRTIAKCRLDPSFVPDVFLPEQVGRSYEDFITKQTTGNITLMIQWKE